MVESGNDMGVETSPIETSEIVRVGIEFMYSCVSEENDLESGDVTPGMELNREELEKQLTVLMEEYIKINK